MPLFGIAQWFHIGDDAAVEATLEGLDRLGCSSLRTGVSWADYHTPQGRAWYDWLLPRLGRQLDLLPCVTYTPPSLGRFASTAAPPRNPQAYADFLDVLVTEHGRWFGCVELWNEPNNLLDWDWRADPEWRIFSEMIGKAAYWMKRRGKTTVLGGMCPTDANWLRLVGERGVLAYIDVVGIHGFPETWSHHFPGWEAEAAAVRAVLRQFGAQDLWITEGGHASWRHDEHAQVRHLLDMLEAPVTRAYWYSHSDLDPARTTQAGYHFDVRHYHTGLFTAAGRAKLPARLIGKGGIAELRAFARTILRRRPGRRARPIVVTGGCGFLGCNLVDALASRGEEVLVLDNFSRPGSEENAEWLAGRHGPAVAFEAADIRDRPALAPLLSNARAVLHLASQVAVTTSIEDPYTDFTVNAAGTVSLLEAMRAACPGAAFVLASTNKVYGRLLEPAQLDLRPDGWWPAPDTHTGAADSRNGVHEDAPLEFHSPYGCSKGAADQYANDFARSFGLQTVVLRMSCIYGPRQFGTEDQGWIAHFMRSAIEDRPLTIYGDGHQVRDALYVDDAVAAWLAVLANIGRMRGRTFNLGGGAANAISLRRLVDVIAARRGRRPQVRFAEPRPGDQLWYVSDTRALRLATGWRPRVPLHAGLSRLAGWLEQRFAPPAEPEAMEAQRTA